MKFLFFLLFYVILGTTGITLPWLVNQTIESSDVAIGLVTIIMSTVGYNATEKILQIIEEKANRKTTAFVNLVALVLALLVTIVVCNLIDKNIAIVISVIAYILSCSFWWFQNWNNKNIESTSQSTLGGSSKQFN